MSVANNLAIKRGMQNAERPYMNAERRMQNAERLCSAKSYANKEKV